MKEICKIQALGRREATSGIAFLQALYKHPITTSGKVIESLKFSRTGAMQIIERFIELEILKPLNENAKYGKTYFYKDYIDIFNT